VTILDGDPGRLKSVITIDLAARITTGRRMPDDTASDLDGPRGVVLLSAEDDADDTIRPRLDAADGDGKHVVILQAVKEDGGEYAPTISDLDALEEAIQSVDAALVVIDPLMAHIPDGRDSHKDQDIRRSLAPLGKLAARLAVAIIVIRHLNKAAAIGNALYRGGGSIGIIGAARSGLLAALDPDDPNKARYILAVLPACVKEVRKQAREAGVSDITLQRAKTSLGAVSKKSGFHGGWVWTLPGPARPAEGDHEDRHTLADDHLRAEGPQTSRNDAPPAEGDHTRDNDHLCGHLQHTATDDGQVVFLRALAETWKWPSIYIGWGESIPAGEAAWAQFLRTATDERTMWAIEDLQSLEGGRPS
jgi:hypothetical protein